MHLQGTRGNFPQGPNTSLGSLGHLCSTVRATAGQLSLGGEQQPPSETTGLKKTTDPYNFTSQKYCQENAHPRAATSLSSPTPTDIHTGGAETRAQAPAAPMFAERYSRQKAEAPRRALMDGWINKTCIYIQWKIIQPKKE